MVPSPLVLALIALNDTTRLHLRPHLPLLAPALLGLLIRLAGFFGPGGLLLAPTGYDDGVYFSSSALLVRGVLPYHDFVFVHPPGSLYFFALTSWVPDPAIGFAAARVLVSILGTINIFLLGWIVTRAAGPFGGVVAAVLYAIDPDAIIAERSAFLEPVLNFLCLAAVLVWLRGRRPVLAGALLGAACAVKLWGGIWMIAALAATPRERLRSDVPRFLVGALVTGLLLVLPAAVPALDGFIEQTLLFQLERPPDGTIGVLARLRELTIDSPHRAAFVLGLIGLFAMRWRREERLFAIATLLTIAAFLVSPTYWASYNAHLAASLCGLAGFGAAALLRIRRVPQWATALGVALLVAGLQVTMFPRIRETARGWSPEMLTFAHDVPQLVPADASPFALDPSWNLAARRLPPHGDGTPVIVDSYAATLMRGQRPSIRARLDASPFVLLGNRAWQLGDAERAWLASHFECMNPEAGELCVWQRRAQPFAGTPPPQAIQFVEGWYGVEGVPPKTWRWMSRRAVAKLPPRNGVARLELALEVPSENPTITVELDGRLIDRFVATTKEVTRRYDVPVAGEQPHVLVLSTDRAIVPAQVGASGDTRELGLNVRRLAWRRR
jgi:hypothetical protein